MFSGDTFCTISTVVIGINLLLDKLELWEKTLGEKPERTTTYENVILALNALRDKILKHYNKPNWIYCVSINLDPRHKKETFKHTNWGKDLQDMSVSTFENMYRDLYYLDDENSTTTTADKNGKNNKNYI